MDTLEEMRAKLESIKVLLASLEYQGRMRN